MTLEGLSAAKACDMLAGAGIKCSIVEYRSHKPYADVDSRRVVRARKLDAALYELVVCEFKTEVGDDSQG